MQSECFIHFPSFPLSEFISFIRVAKGSIFTERAKILPAGNVRLIFNLSPSHTAFVEKGSKRTKIGTRSCVYGIHDHHITLQTEIEMDLVVIGFRPGGAYAFFQFPMSELTNQLIETELINSGLIERTLEELYKAPDNTEKVKVVENMLLRSLFFQKNPVQSLSHYLCYNPLSVNELIEKFGYSHTYTNSLFKKYIGMSPKKFYRLCRFRKILKMAKNQKELNWKSISYQLGYHDHAHFTHDFKEFSDLTPKQYSLKKMFSEIICSVD